MLALFSRSRQKQFDHDLAVMQAPTPDPVALAQTWRRLVFPDTFQGVATDDLLSTPIRVSWPGLFAGPGVFIEGDNVYRLASYEMLLVSESETRVITAG